MPVISPLGKWSLAATFWCGTRGMSRHRHPSSTTGCRVIFRPVRAPGQNGGHLPGVAGVGHDPNNAGTPQYHHPNSPPYINNHSEIFMTSLPSTQGEGPRVRSSVRRQECRGTPSDRKQDTPERPQPGHMEGGRSTPDRRPRHVPSAGWPRPTIEANASVAALASVMAC